MSIKTVYLKKIIIGLFLTGAIFLISLSTEAASQSDAIAVRVMPNVNHDSIETWYAKQGFKGSPQSLIVDGYEAIRDGRTVFVNAANIDLNSKKIYTNIYLISYNQESETKTLDILGQLVSHWKFNDNISTQGSCSISSINCQADSECPTDYICSNANSGNGSPDYQSFTKGKCVLKKNKTCRIDSDCPANLFCDSLKARTIRDISRLGQINKITDALESFKSINGRYPALDSGTYVLGSSLSVWPSWKENLWSQLTSQPIVDPVNSLGYCEGYEASTCWNNKNNTFVNSDLSLPSGSYAFVYKALRGGIDYSLCATFETSVSGYNTTEGGLLSKNCNTTNFNKNNAPILVDSVINGVSGKEFNGYIMVKDNEGDTVSWKLAPLSNFSSWSSVPVLVNTNVPGQKKIYAARTGNIGNYEMNLILTDSQGATSVTKIVIKVDVIGKVKIEAQNAVYSVDAINPTYTFSVIGNNLEKQFSINALDSKYSGVFSNDLESTAFSSDLNGLQITVPVNIPKINLIKEANTTVPFRISFFNYGSKITKDINITFTVEKPLLNFQCDSSARIGQPYQVSGYSCLLGSAKSGNYNLSYQLTTTIPGLFIKTQSSNDYLTANAISVLAPTSSDVTVKVKNQYNLTAEKTFKLTVNSFCGDGIKQTPNSEGRGGINNDGNEECDGLDGVATSVSNSENKQYACTTGLNVKTPFPISNNNSCVFAGPLAGGGYCGDGYCQTDKENCSTCKSDCGKCGPVCGDGEIDPGESCEAGQVRECDQVTQWINPPGYCGTVNRGNLNVKGFQTCNSTCSGWGTCVGGSPDLMANSSTSCGTTNPQEYNYSCCELIACIPDGCDCCGRDSNVNWGSGWIDLEDRAVSTYKYEDVITRMSPSNKMCSIYTTPCICGASTDYFGNPADCPDTPACPGVGDDPTNNSCVLARDADNLKNWMVLTNHTTAYYRCWK